MLSFPDSAGDLDNACPMKMHTACEEIILAAESSV